MSKRTKVQVHSGAATQPWHKRDDQKEGYWRKHLESWRDSGLSKRAYCTQNDLPYSSFFAWRREIELRDREHKSPVKVTPVVNNADAGSNPFVPIRILSDKAAQKTERCEPAARTVHRQQIEIELPSGAVIRLNDDSDPDFVAKLLTNMNA